MERINRERYRGIGRPRKCDYEGILSLVGIVLGTGIVVSVSEYLIKLVG